jgi:hypothetical protein
MKKTIILFAVLFGSVATVLAQDIIMLKNGDEIKASVQEVGIADVKYKKHENLNGPTYTLLKSEIFMIKYENGEKDIFKDAPAAPSASSSVKPQEVVSIPTPAAPSVSSFVKPQEAVYLKWRFRGSEFTDANGKYLSYSKMRSILANAPKAWNKYKTGFWLDIVGDAGMNFSWICLCIAIGDVVNDVSGPAAAIWGSFSVAGALLGIMTHAIGNSEFEKVYNLYQNAKTKTTTSLHFGLTRSGGIGLTLTF